MLLECGCGHLTSHSIKNVRHVIRLSPDKYSVLLGCDKCPGKTPFSIDTLEAIMRNENSEPIEEKEIVEMPKYKYLTVTPTRNGFLVVAHLEHPNHSRHYEMDQYVFETAKNMADWMSGVQPNNEPIRTPEDTND